MALRDLFSAAVERIAIPVFIADERCALGHSVTDAVLELDIMQYLLYFAVEGSTTDDQITELTTKGLVQTLFDFATDDAVDNRSLPEHLHQRRTDLRQHPFLHDLLDN